MSYIKFSINDILVDDIQTINKSFECSICMELVFKKEIFQCKEGHWNCKDCWVKSLKTRKECMQCKTPVKSTGSLSRCRYIENEFSYKRVYCPNSFEINTNNNDNKAIVTPLIKATEENGCKEIVTIEELDNHLEQCKQRYIKCPSEECNIVFRLNQLEHHKKECKFALITCEYCKLENVLKTHYETCPKILINCNQQCEDGKFQIERDLLQTHIDYNCPNTLMPCRFKDVGCNDKIKRSDLSAHLLLPVHMVYLMNKIEKQSTQLEKQSSKYDKQLSKLEESNKKYAKQIEQLNNKCEQLSETIKKTTSKQYHFYKGEWVVNNISEIIKTYKPHQLFASPPVKIDNNNFYLKLFPNTSKEGENYFGLFFYCDKEYDASVTFTFICKDPSKNKTCLFSNKKINNIGMGWYEALKVSDLASNGLILEGDTIKVEYIIELNPPHMK